MMNKKCKVVVAIDSLKGSISSIDAGNAIAAGIKKAGEADVTVMNMADGGEGTMDALTCSLNGKKVHCIVKGPSGEKVTAEYGIVKENKLAIIEIASAVGITLKKEKHPDIYTSYGVGELIAHGISAGCRNFIIGLGGSATNDGGLGMLKALGYEFYDKWGNTIESGYSSLNKIHNISDKNKLKALDSCTFKIACDVDNPLMGKNGATYIYGPQKGILAEQLGEAEQAMKHYATLTNEFNGSDYVDYPGAGAAGGMGFAFLSYLNGKIQPGIDLVMEIIELEKNLKDAQIVITGEGRIDGQSVHGKTPVGVAKLAHKHGALVIALAGSLTEEAYQCNHYGIDALFPILPSVMTLEDAMDTDNVKKNLSNTAEQIFRLIFQLMK